MTPLSVDQLTDHLEGLFLGDPLLKSISIRGEMLGTKKHTSGHLYFSLSGTRSRISCVMFRSDTVNLPKWPRDGDDVIVNGRVSIYPARGTYQVYARQILPMGIGAAARAKAELKERLEKEGLFDPRLKRPLPAFPSRVAVITSATGAALRDVLKVSHLRFPVTEIILVPSLVQGLEAPDELVNSIRLLNFIDNLDAAMLVRGGGSRDDLNPFDDERVVRAVRLSPVPLVTGLGHQIDLTLSDMAADVFASTPSAAAERLLPDMRDMFRILAELKTRASRHICSKTEYLFSGLSKDIRYLNSQIRERLTRLRTDTENLSEGISRSAKRNLDAQKACLERISSSLENLSPRSVLLRGFITCEELSTGKPVAHAGTLRENENYRLRFSDGSASVVVESIEKITEI